ncbi:MAG: NUDIX domain-containing protein [Candidatus Micrarchaeaceae archaeon]|jgi:8-oxo-dGTP pyrophosphatase MutT (NUDIX family)
MKEFSISAAIILVSSDRKVLVLQRNPNDSFPNKWTVPGGKLKDVDFDNVSEFSYYPAEYAAVREVKEETGIEVKADELEFLCSLYLKEINRIVISFYAVLDKKSDEFKISLKDNQDFKWIGSEDIKSYDFIPDIGSEIEAAYKKITKN